MTPKQTDLDTARKALLTAGFYTQADIKNTLLITREGASDTYRIQSVVGRAIGKPVSVRVTRRGTVVEFGD